MLFIQQTVRPMAWILILRCLETIGVLKKIGLNKEHLYFLGVEEKIKDGESHMQMEKIFSFIYNYCEKKEINNIYLLAWEGGHIDHDICHIIGIALAKIINVRLIYECSGYNGFSRVLPFRVMKFIPRAVQPNFKKIRLVDGLFYISLIRYYRSQWKTWTGLFIESSIRYVILRKHERRVVQDYDYRIAPHQRPLFYEERFKVAKEDVDYMVNKFFSTLPCRDKEGSN